MSPTEVVIVLFSVCNSLRVIAYLPQLASVWRDTNGAGGVSLTTWTLFTLANLSTTAYALVVVDDMRMVLLFGFNTIFSFGIAFGTLVKRRASRSRSLSTVSLGAPQGARGRLPPR